MWLHRHLPARVLGLSGFPPPPRWDGSARLLFPLSYGDYNEHLGSLREMVDVRHAAGGVTGKRLQLVLMGSYDHDMWTHVEVLVWSLSWRSLVRYPGTRVHVCDANPVAVSRSACQTILDPLQEDSRKANNAPQVTACSAES